MNLKSKLDEKIQNRTFTGLEIRKYKLDNFNSNRCHETKLTVFYLMTQ